MRRKVKLTCIILFTWEVFFVFSQFLRVYFNLIQSKDWINFDPVLGLDQYTSPCIQFDLVSKILWTIWLANSLIIRRRKQRAKENSAFRGEDLEAVACKPIRNTLQFARLRWESETEYGNCLLKGNDLDALNASLLL